MRYGDCRWVDIEATNKEEVVVVCPVAALEQHGHHLPLLTDTYLVTEVAERVEKALPEKVLLTPTLWMGSSDHHLDFPGTVSLPASLYVEVLKQTVRCFIRAGFRRILLLPRERYKEKEDYTVEYRDDGQVGVIQLETIRKFENDAFVVALK